MPFIKPLAAAPAVLAAFSLTFAPLAAAEIPVEQAAPAYGGANVVQQIEEAQTSNHGRYYRYRYRRGPGVGDVLAGVLIVGAIAHAAKAATRDDRRYRDRDYRRDARWDDERGIDRAVQMCADAVDRERRVETVDRVDRTARGWTVEGTVSRGGGFRCFIGNDGRIDDIEFGGRDSRYDREDRDDDDRYEDIGYEGDDRGYDDEAGDRDYAERDAGDGQWDDDRYASEWSKVDRGPTATAPAPQDSYRDETAEAEVDAGADLDIGTGYTGA